MKYCIIQNDYYNTGVSLYYYGDDLSEAIRKIVNYSYWNCDEDPDICISKNNCIYVVGLGVDWTIFELEDETEYIVLRENYYDYDVILIGETNIRSDAYIIKDINKRLKLNREYMENIDDISEYYTWYIFDLKE